MSHAHRTGSRSDANSLAPRLLAARCWPSALDRPFAAGAVVRLQPPIILQRELRARRHRLRGEDLAQYRGLGALVRRGGHQAVGGAEVLGPGNVPPADAQGLVLRASHSPVVAGAVEQAPEGGGAFVA